MTTAFYNKYLLFIAGLGGLLYGIDVGVIAGALPYLQATTPYTAAQLSFVVAAVLLGSVLSSLFAGSLADIFGRKWMMIVSGVCFVLSVPVICIPTGFEWLVAGRILQGAAAGFIGAFKAYSDAVALFGTDLNAAGMNTIVGYVYDMLYGDSGGYPSYASAAAILLFVIVLTITCINLLVTRRRDGGEGGVAL